MFLARLLCAGLLVTVAACSGQQKELDETHTNLRARESTLHRPAGGTPTMRTYRNPRYAGVGFTAIVVEDPEVTGAIYDDHSHRAFLKNLRGALLDGTARALASSGRYLEVLPPDAPRDLPRTARCRTEVLPHVTPSANSLVRDAVFGEVQPRVTVVYTITDAENGEVVLKYTEWAVSQWEYGPWAMEELVAAAVGIANHFGVVSKVF